MPAVSIPAGPINQAVAENLQPFARAQGTPPPGATATPDAALPPGLANRAAGAATAQAVPTTQPTASTVPTGNAPQSAPLAGDPAQKLPPADAARQAALSKANAAADAPLAARTEGLPPDRFATLRRPVDAAVAMTTALAAAATNATQSLGAFGRVDPTAQIPVDSRVGMLPTDRAQAARGDVPLGAPIYIGDGPWRRRSRRLAKALPAQLTRWLQQAGVLGHQGAPASAESENELGFHLRWMYWTLAIVAYGCLALALTALVQSHVDVVVVRRPPPVAPLLGIGAAAAVAAWWVAKRMTRR